MGEHNPKATKVAIAVSITTATTTLPTVMEESVTTVMTTSPITTSTASLSSTSSYKARQKQRRRVQQLRLKQQTKRQRLLAASTLENGNAAAATTTTTTTTDAVETRIHLQHNDNNERDPSMNMISLLSNTSPVNDTEMLSSVSKVTGARNLLKPFLVQKQQLLSSTPGIVRNNSYDQHLVYNDENDVDDTAIPRRNKDLLILSDIKGIQEIVCHRLHHRSAFVAIPTECTYEIVHAFPVPSPIASSNIVTATNCDVVIGNQPQYHVYIPTMLVFDHCPFWKRVLPKKSYGVRRSSIVSAAPTDQGSTVPTTKTQFESPSDNPTCPTSPTTPPAPQHEDKIIITKFNESIQVLRRIATKCWPGPMIIYIQVQESIQGLTISMPSTTTSGSEGNCHQHYIALRKPCHPLSRKVCSEFYKRVTISQQQQECSTDKHQMNDCRSSIGDGSTASSTSCQTTPAVSPMMLSSTNEAALLSSTMSSLRPPFTITPCRVVETKNVSQIHLEGNTNSMGSTAMSPTSDFDHSKLSQDLPHDMEASPRVEHSLASLLLVGTPMIKYKKEIKSKAQDKHNTVEYIDKVVGYVQSADQAVKAIVQQQSNNTGSIPSMNKTRQSSDVTAVLHGEERYEILSVPTCMYQQPYPISIWINSSERTVHIKSNTKDSDVLLDQCNNTSTSPTTVTCKDDEADRRDGGRLTTSQRTTSFLSLQDQQYMIDEATILTSLRNVERSSRSLLLAPPPPIAPTTVPSTTTTGNGQKDASLSSSSTTTKWLNHKERVLHAVLLKWKVTSD